MSIVVGEDDFDYSVIGSRNWAGDNGGGTGWKENEWVEKMRKWGI